MPAMQNARRSRWQRRASESFRSSQLVPNRGIAMQRRTLLSASLGLGALSSLAGDAILFDPPQRTSRQSNQAMTGLSFYSGMDLAFGTTVSIKVLHTDRSSAATAIQDALHQVKKIDALMSVYQERSQVFQLNRD